MEILRRTFDRGVTNPLQESRATPPQRGANILEGMSDDRYPAGRAPCTAFFFVRTLRQTAGLDA